MCLKSKPKPNHSPHILGETQCVGREAEILYFTSELHDFCLDIQSTDKQNKALCVQCDADTQQRFWSLLFFVSCSSLFLRDC